MNTMQLLKWVLLFLVEQHHSYTVNVCLGDSVCLRDSRQPVILLLRLQSVLLSLCNLSLGAVTPSHTDFCPPAAVGQCVCETLCPLSIPSQHTLQNNPLLLNHLQSESTGSCCRPSE